MSFLPYFPPRMARPPSVFRRLALARRNLLSIWEEDAFQYEFASAAILRRRIFLCNCPEAVQFAFSSNNASFERKSAQHRGALQPLLGDGLFVSDGETWRKRRRIVAPTIHVSRLPAFAPVMVEAALEARAALSQRAGQTVDMLEETAQLTAEIISRTLFGRRLGREHAGAVVAGFSDYQRQIGLDMLSFLGLPQWLPRWQGRGVRRAAHRVLGVLDSIIADCRKSGEQDSVVQALLAARDEETGEALSDAAIRNEAAVLFMAGHETTANTLAWALYLLSQDPAAQAALQAETDTVLGSRAPTLSDVPRLVYTRAVLEETMRLYPPVPFLTREAVTDEEFRGRRIPKGSMILVAPWLLHRQKKFWDRPDHFVPERFLPGAPEISKFLYIPFSIGPRVCAGLSFGLTEAILCLAVLAQGLTLRLAPGADVRPVCRLTLRPESGLPMTVEIRSSQAAAAPASPGVCPHGH